MRFKPFIIIVPAVAMTAGLWLWFHHPAPPPAPATPVKPAPASMPLSVAANGPKMTTVMSQPAAVQTLSPSASDWTSALKIADTRASHGERLKAVSSLSGHLTEADWAVLQAFLLKPDGLDQSQTGQVIKNELLDALCALDPPPAGLGDVLAKMYQDPGQNEVIRDYAVQHLAAAYGQAATQTNHASLESAIQKTLWQAVTETGDSIGGTALLALKRLSEEYTNFDQGKIAAAALQMAGDGNAGELSHITAYQVCAQMGTADALPVVLSAAQDGETISVRMSAIGALGSLGGQDQITFLNSLLQGDEDRLKPAAQHALDRINDRQTQATNQK